MPSSKCYVNVQTKVELTLWRHFPADGKPWLHRNLCCIHKMLLARTRLVLCGFQVTSAWPVTGQLTVLQKQPNSCSSTTWLNFTPTTSYWSERTFSISGSLRGVSRLWIKTIHAIEPRVNTTKFHRLTSRDEINNHLIRFGHTFLTHGHLVLKKESPLQRSACQAQLTVELVLLLCPTLNAIRVNRFTVTNLFNFSTKSPNVDAFIEEIGFYRRIWQFDTFHFYLYNISVNIQTPSTHFPNFRILTSPFNVIFEFRWSVFINYLL